MVEDDNNGNRGEAWDDEDDYCPDCGEDWDDCTCDEDELEYDEDEEEDDWYGANEDLDDDELEDE